ncbi:MAG TPA: ATP-binding protein [Rhodanobacteraceae bacterium]|nr:ATP-binding protein [Rhodanobacteraceae bacterium]
MSDPSPILVSWSGGKDCLMALARLRADPRWRVVGLLTTVTRTWQRIAMHGIRRDVLHAQARALRLPVLEAGIDWPADNASYERAHQEALARAAERWRGLRHCAFGDIFLADVRDYRIRQLGQAGWRAEFPLWGEDTGTLSRQFIADGHRAHLACVDTSQLDARFCGRTYDATLLDALPAGVDPCGERGEFHTLAFGGPLFNAELPLRRGESLLREERFQYTDFLLEDAP